MYLSNLSFQEVAYMMYKYLHYSKKYSETNFYLYDFFSIKYKEYSNSSIEDIIKKSKNSICVDEKEEFLNILAALKSIDNQLLKKYNADKKDELQINMIPISADKSTRIWLAVGKKVWADKRFANGNCFFSMIRAIEIVGNNNITFESIWNKIKDEKLFDNDELTVFTAHALNCLKLSVNASDIFNVKSVDFIETVDVKKDDNTGGSPIYEKSQEAIEEAFKDCSDKTKVLMFPELMLDEKESIHFLDYLNNKHKQDKKNISLLIIGEKHNADYPDSNYGRYNNIAAIYYWNRDEEKWLDLAKYNKIIPFSCKHPTKGKKYVCSENLCNRDEKICILPFKDCIVGVAICRDVLDILNLDNPIHEYMDFIDILFVPSYNMAETNMFIGVAETFARWHNCAVVYVNYYDDEASNNKFSGMVEYSFAIAPYKDEEKSGANSISGVATYNINDTILKAIEAKCKYININNGYQYGIDYTMRKKGVVSYISKETQVSREWLHHLSEDNVDE